MTAHRTPPLRSASLGALALVGISALGAARAAADAVPPAPTDCPRGSHGTTDHMDTYCVPSECATASDCSPPSDIGTPNELTCTANVGLCLVSRTTVPGGRFPDGIVPGPVTYDAALGACTTDADCAAPAHCVVVSRCTPLAPPPAPSSGSSSCAATPGPARGRVGVLVALAALVLHRSARHASRRARG